VQLADHSTPPAPHEQAPPRTAGALLPALLRGLLAALAGALLVLLLSQLPTTHTVDIGSYDAAYVQGFHDAHDNALHLARPPYVRGSDGSVRWSRATSYLLFPQAGLPAEVTLRLRGWRPSPDEPAPRVQIWLNGRELLAEVQTSTSWQEHTLSLAGPGSVDFLASGLLKASDVVLELRSTPIVQLDDGRQVGVLLDRATYRVQAGTAGIIWPYPSQLIFGGLAGLLLWLTVQSTTLPPRHKRRLLLAGGLLLALLFAGVSRVQPPLYPYPLRWLLPHSVLLLAALLALQRLPARLVRAPALVDALALGGVVLWLGAVLLAAQQHVTLSIPGVERDFRVFATRTVGPAEIFRADGFYNFGYPLLLWLVQPLTSDNAFLAARLLAALCGALLLLASYGLARGLLATLPGASPLDVRLGALLALLALAYSPLVVQHALYVGSDMPLAACVALALALLLAGMGAASPPRRAALLVLAGMAGGCAFLMRHPGLTLLPWGVLCCLLLLPRAHGWRAALCFAGGLLLVAAPQLTINTLETGQPLYNQQAKNVWLAVYGNIDWRRWGEVSNSVSLLDLLLRDPARFLGNWWSNLLAFIGTGAENTGEFGRALHLRLLSWPANWLAVLGLAGWLALALRGHRNGAQVALLAYIALYAPAIAMAFVLPRFFLPLAPIYAAAAGWLVVWALRHLRPMPELARVRGLLLALLLLLALVSSGFASGTRLVLEHQPADEVAAVRLTLAHLQPGERVLTRVPAEVPLAKYSALAHRALPWPTTRNTAAVLADARANGAAYLLWDERRGSPPLRDPAAAHVGSAGMYGLYRLADD
jgi:4-amino-4-deoxy-L-arabinose transferase-like glycosyltransferase